MTQGKNLNNAKKRKLFSKMITMFRYKGRHDLVKMYRKEVKKRR